MKNDILQIQGERRSQHSRTKSTRICEYCGKNITDNNFKSYHRTICYKKSINNKRIYEPTQPRSRADELFKALIKFRRKNK